MWMNAKALNDRSGDKPPSSLLSCWVVMGAGFLLATRIDSYRGRVRGSLPVRVLTRRPGPGGQDKYMEQWVRKT